MCGEADPRSHRPRVISPNASRSPTSVVSVKFSPRSSVATSQRNGNPGGAPRRYGWWGQAEDQPLEILGGAPIDHVDIACESDRSMDDGRHAAHEDALHTGVGQGSEGAP